MREKGPSHSSPFPFLPSPFSLPSPPSPRSFKTTVLHATFKLYGMLMVNFDNQISPCAYRQRRLKRLRSVHRSTGDILRSTNRPSTRSEGGGLLLDTGPPNRSPVNYVHSRVTLI